MNIDGAFLLGWIGGAFSSALISLILHTRATRRRRD